MGPVLNAAKRDELESPVALAKADGATHQVIYPQTDRTAEPWVKSGSYAQPVIACCDESKHALKVQGRNDVPAPGRIKRAKRFRSRTGIVQRSAARIDRLAIQPITNVAKEFLTSSARRGSEV